VGFGGGIVSTFTASASKALQLLRQLPPRERLRVVAEALLDLEQDLSDTSPVPDFWEGVDIRALAESRGIQPVDDFDALLGGWPEDESVDDFILAIRAERRQNLAEVDA
jgi:ABC-type nitrate/sulfonate/bicarbonate transport system substrate-binding protein